MFASRVQAGKILADVLKHQGLKADCVLGIPRGGVVVANQIAKKLHLPLVVLLVKKIGAPHNPELAIGAIVESDNTSKHEFAADGYDVVSRQHIAKLKRKKVQELRTQKSLYRHKIPHVQGRTVILVDDGVATGITINAVIRWLRLRRVKAIYLALPVASFEFAGTIRPSVEGMYILETPQKFQAVGQYYRDFQQVSDEEVIDILNRKLFK